MEVALGRTLPPHPPAVHLHHNLVALFGEANLARPEIMALVSDRVRENLDKLVLYEEPRA